MFDIPADAIKLTWDQAYQQSVKLARMIEAHCRQTGERFDAMLVVPRGGYYPANIVARELGFDAASMLSASVASYLTGNKAGQGKFRTGQLPASEQVEGKNIIMIDELCETGQTLQFIHDYLKDNGAKLVRSGVIHHKPSKSTSDFKPDWVVAEVGKWVVYPWEPHEEQGLKSQARRPD